MVFHSKVSPDEDTSLDDLRQNVLAHAYSLDHCLESRRLLSCFTSPALVVSLSLQIVLVSLQLPWWRLSLVLDEYGAYMRHTTCWSNCMVQWKVVWASDFTLSALLLLPRPAHLTRLEAP